MTTSQLSISPQSKSLLKEVVQTNWLVTARYDINRYEKNILYKIIQLIQYDIEGQPIGEGITIEPTELMDKWITMPVSEFLPEDDTTSYSRIVEGFKNLMQIVIERKDHQRRVTYPVIQKLDENKERGQISFKVDKDLYRDLLCFAKGYSRYDVEVALKFSSTYSMRFYELTTGNKKPVSYKIDTLRWMLKLEARYRDTSSFIKKVVDPAAKEVKGSDSSTYFTRQILRKGQKITHVRFFNHAREAAKDKNPSQHSLNLEDVPVALLSQLTTFLGTKEQQWKPHAELLRQVAKYVPAKEIEKIITCSKKYADNPIGYVVEALKKQVQLNSPDIIWGKCMDTLKEKLPQKDLDKWFKPIIPIKIKDKRLTVKVPSERYYTYIEAYYLEELSMALRGVIGTGVQLQYKIR